MSITINDYIKKCKFVLSNILDEQERIVLANENIIVNINKNQFTDGYGSDNKDLNNIIKEYTGFYKSGELKGQRYDFFNTGQFIQGLKIDMQPSLTKFDIFSTGTGSGDKSVFFAGYTNLFGLDKTNADIVNYEIILPQLMKYIKRYL
jgi:hypothetical protein